GRFACWASLGNERQASIEDRSRRFERHGSCQPSGVLLQAFDKPVIGREMGHVLPRDERVFHKDGRRSRLVLEDVGRQPMMRCRYFYSYWKYATQPIMRVFALRNSARP